MPTISCPKCGKVNYDKAKACIQCGYPLAAQQEQLASELNSIFDAILDGRDPDPKPQPELPKTPAGNVDLNALFGEYFTGKNNIPNQQRPNTAPNPQQTAPQFTSMNEFMQFCEENGVHFTSGRNTAASQSAPQPPVSDAEMDRRVRKYKSRLYRGPIFTFCCMALFIPFIICAYLVPPQIQIIFSLIALAFYIPGLIGLINIFRIFKIRKRVRVLESRNLLKRALWEMDHQPRTPFGDKAALTEHFLIRNRKHSNIIIPCEDILLVYSAYSDKYLSVFVCTRYFGKIRISGTKTSRPDHRAFVQQGVSELEKRNPDFMVNKTAANLKAYESMRVK